MFCQKCGSQNAEGMKFCSSCGQAMPVAAQQAAQAVTPVQQPPRNEEEKRKKAGGFWASGAGIALVVILGLALIAGVTLGIVFLVKDNPNNEVDAATVQVWDEYETVLADDGASLAQVNMDPNALAKSREDLAKTQKRVEALEKVLQKTGGTEAKKQNARNTRRVATNNTRDKKAAEMAAALEAYKTYIKKLDELYGVFILGNLLDPVTVNLVNAILKDLQTLAANVKGAAGAFLNNNTKVIAKAFNPPVLMLAKTISTEVDKTIQAKQEAEKQRVAAEQAAAQQAAAAAAAQQQQAAAAAAAAAQQQQESAGPSQDYVEPDRGVPDAPTEDCGDPMCPI